MIGIIGGTGPEGRGLAVRWAMAGEKVAIGSRLQERGETGAAAVNAIIPDAGVSGDANKTVAGASDVVVIAVPLEAVKETVSAIALEIEDKIVVSVVAALEWIDGRPHPVLLPAGSVAQEIQNLLPRARVTSAFHTLSAEKLADPLVALSEDTIVCGDVREARHEVMGLARRISGIRPVSGGRLNNSYYPEVLVGMLAGMNRIYKTHTGFKIVGIESQEN